MKLNFKSTDKLVLKFHKDGFDYILTAMYNKQIGQWFQVNNDGTGSYYLDKKNLSERVKSILEDNEKQGIKSELTITPVKS